MNALQTTLIVGAAALLIAALVVAVGRLLRRRMLDPPGVKAAAQALRTAGLAAPPLREGLTSDSAAQALPYLLALLETPGVALCGPDGAVLGALGPGAHHAGQVLETVVVAMRERPAAARQLPAVWQAGLPGEPGRHRTAGRRWRLGGWRVSGQRVDGWRVGRCAGGAGRVSGRPVSGPGHRRNRAVHHHPARTRRPGRLPGRSGQGRGQGVARADLSAFHLQRADHHCRLRPERSGPGARVVAGVRRFHPVFVPAGRRIHHPGRRNGQHREVPDPGTGPVRRPAADPLAGGPGGARRRGAVPVDPAAGRERRPARPGRSTGRRHRVGHRGGRRAGLRDQCRGRRHRDGPASRSAGTPSTIPSAVTSDW